MAQAASPLFCPLDGTRSRTRTPQPQRTGCHPRWPRGQGRLRGSPELTRGGGPRRAQRRTGPPRARAELPVEGAPAPRPRRSVLSRCSPTRIEPRGPAAKHRHAPSDSGEKADTERGENLKKEPGRQRRDHQESVLPTFKHSPLWLFPQFPLGFLLFSLSSPNSLPLTFSGVSSRKHMQCAACKT